MIQSSRMLAVYKVRPQPLIEKGSLSKSNPFLVKASKAKRLLTMTKFAFLQAFDIDIQSSLLNQIRDLWAHSSTALEGNTLSLAETKFIIEEGLTIGGKSIEDHQEVLGHVRAMKLLYQLVEKEITQQNLFELHAAILPESTSENHKPRGAWKNVQDGTYATDSNEQQVYINYSSPEDIPDLIQEWLAELRVISKRSLTMNEAVSAYCQLHMGFVHIHPFWDGNGRLARLLSNIPLLKSGFPPLIISKQDRKEYIQLLANYQIDTGVITTHTGVWPETKSHGEFENFCMREYQVTLELVENAKVQ